MIKRSSLASLSFLLLAALLSGCGGSDTTIVERDPIPIDDDHDHDHDDETPHRGRLLVSLKNDAKVHIIDINEKALLEAFTLSEPASALYASPGYRYGFVVQRTADKVNVIDGGAYQENHGDHMHDIIQAPQWMSFHTDASRPTHVTHSEDQTAIFFDGNASTGTPAAVVVFSEADIAGNGSGTWLEYTTHMHGAAQARGDYLLSTIRDPLSATTLPDRVGLYHAHHGHFDEEEVFSETCPGLHGSAQRENQVAFGCTDGVLLITQDDDTFTASKIANPAAFTGSKRIGTLLGYHSASEFVGIASGEFFRVTAEGITAIAWQDTSLETAPSALGYGYADSGEFFVILDSQGWITLLNTEDWSIAKRIQAITSNLAALPAGSTFELALTPGHIVYVSDPIANQIKQIDLDQGEISDTIQLSETLNKITWIGIPEPTGGNHGH
ncbi:hypothetical protein [Cellvibrio japonicus]|nr:hypothetical protein [Cellvibrio japonicus]QEI11890.1 5-methyltetrahydrofolate--homocysteine methyltransferase [Cellvibrio japonicus]QEI15464.1 5-methyltetrahydrofolate--homocysteine methyltransferase [Cellvibrio japonicus]QEI19043.1 5-methyltetrahydrofolate--homocysteine methyltransferase [Cellvibrio japonicus]